MAASATLIAGGISGLNVQVLGFTDWPLSRGDTARTQVLPDPPRRSAIVGLDVAERAPAVIALPGRAVTAVPTAGALGSDHTRPAVAHDRSGLPRDPARPAPLAHAADSDGDGLSDAIERALGTDPQRTDTDGDGIPDAYEVDNKLNPRYRADAGEDLDGDGVSNRNEYLVKADPRVADSNGDGVSDGADDPDGDGIPSAVEQRLGLNPATSLTRDAAAGVTDVLKPPAKANPVDETPLEPAEAPPEPEPAPGDEPAPIADGDVDSDGDGATNAAELAAGTDPADPASKPQPVPVDPPPVDPPPVDPPPVDPAPVDPPPVDAPPVDAPVPPVDPAAVPADPATDPAAAAVQPPVDPAAATP
jgi:hypothetical protein